MKTLFEAKNIRLGYRTRPGDVLPIVDDVSFLLKKGEILGIAGESGCGKSTLMWGCMNLCNAALCFIDGNVILDGQPLRHLKPEVLRRDIHGKKISMIMQGALNALNPTCKIRTFATDLLLSHDHGMTKTEMLDILHERFTRLGLDPRKVLDAYPFALSGGMRQRVVIALSTLLDPDVVIADEPTSALDVVTQDAVIELLLRLVDEDIIGSLIFITHELPLLKKIATRTAVMYAGHMVEEGSAAQVLSNPRHPYSRALMASNSLIEDASAIALPGSPPSPGTHLFGCRFAPRCPLAAEQCTIESPEFTCKHYRLVRCHHA